MATYDTPRTDLVSNLTNSVGSFLATQILAAIDAGGTVQSDLQITDDYVPGSPIPAGTDILIVQPGQQGAVDVPPGIGAVIYTGPAGVQVSVSAQGSTVVQLTDQADELVLTSNSTDPSTVVSATGGGGNDKITGASNVKNYIDGGSGNDTMIGGTKGDTFVMNSGNDTADGGAGYDRAILKGNINDYSFVRNADGSVSLLNKDGSSATMKGLEYVSFEDGSVMLLTSTELSLTTARLYEVMFGRSGDADGMEYWTEVIQLDPLGAANAMLNSAEFVAQHGDAAALSNEKFLEIMYKTAFDRAPDQIGLDYWIGELTAGRVSKAEVAVLFTKSVEAEQEFSSTIKFLQ